MAGVLAGLSRVRSSVGRRLVAASELAGLLADSLAGRPEAGLARATRHDA
jgi:hypothetical protein